MSFQLRTKQLGQVVPSDTTPLLIFSPSSRDRCVVRNIIICNVTSSTVTYRLFVDEDGTTYNTTTAIAYDIPLAGNTTDVWEVPIYMHDPAGSVAVQTGTGSALTFTANGEDGSIAY